MVRQSCGRLSGAVSLQRWLVAALVGAMVVGTTVAMAKKPQSDDNGRQSSDDRRDQGPADHGRSRGGAESARSTEPVREFRARRDIGDSSGDASRRSGAFRGDRPDRFEGSRTVAARGDDSDTKNDRRRGQGRGDSDSSAPAPRVRSEAPVRRSDSDTGTSAFRRSSTGDSSSSATGRSDSATSGERGSVSDVRRRLGDSAPSTSNASRDAASDSSRTSSDRNIRSGGSNPSGGERFRGRTDSNTSSTTERSRTGADAGDGNRSGISDVRRRLGGSDHQPGAGPDASKSNLQDSRRGPANGRSPDDAQHVKSRTELRGMAAQRFPERLKSGQLDQVVKGENAQRLNLSNQYKMAQQGDVARRLQLQKNVTNVTINKTTNINARSAQVLHYGDHYHGYISPVYSRHAFEYHYCGPRFYAGVCWYPTWDPWVRWSWSYRCRPIWDPRPFWCRPIYYEPCPVWVYYEVPVWTPLPECASGTWVDAKPVVVQANDYNLQLLAVRFVDPGHPEEKQGPRYRVWFRNNSTGPVTQPFNVVLLASTDGRLVPELPQAGVRVTSIEAGDTQSVDLRLPYNVYSMGRDAQGKPASYTTVHVAVDAHREIPQSNRANNGTQLAVIDVLPVDPAAFELDPVNAAPGGEVLVAGEGFGPEPGRAMIAINGQELDAEILGWYDLGVRLRLPAIALAAPTPAEVIIVRGDSAAANPLRITLSPVAAAPQGVVPPPPAPQLQ